MSVTPLLAAKIAQPSVSYYLDSREKGTEIALELIEAGYVEEVVTHRSTFSGYAYSESSFSLTEAGKEFARTAVNDSISPGAPNDFCILWTILLLRGGEAAYYSSSINPVGDEAEVMHLLSCGLNYEKSDMPRDSSWSNFNGTFAEDEDKSGLVGNATCVCGKVRDYEVTMEYSSGIASMLVSISNGVSGLLP